MSVVGCALLGLWRTGFWVYLVVYTRAGVRSGNRTVEFERRLQGSIEWSLVYTIDGVSMYMKTVQVSKVQSAQFMCHSTRATINLFYNIIAVSFLSQRG